MWFRVKKGKIGAFFLFYVILGCLGAFYLSHKPFPYQNDVIEWNRIVKEAERNWDSLEHLADIDSTQPFSVIDLNGRVRFRSGEDAVTSISTALANGDSILDVEEDGSICGKVIVTANIPFMFHQTRKTGAVIFLILFFFFTILGGVYTYYLYKNILKPFGEMKQVAEKISCGNFDVPLIIDKNHIFGAFTESFDLMREQLLLARKREAMANQNRKELVASLSHDMKTPITSIQLISELLLELIKEEKIKQKIAAINQKAQQIDVLITNLFHTTLEDLEHLTVAPAELYSSQLKPMIETEDYYNKVSLEAIPDCLLSVDLLRLSQVINNVLYNSYKYANTPIRITASLSEAHMRLDIRDSGPGVPEEELPFLFNKFYRGKNAATKHGSGLGLYISKKLMKQMEGDIACTCLKDGFCVSLFLKLL